jgi:hypothetical protein
MQSSTHKASKKDGELVNSGVVGCLGDLATIDEKYEVAVSTKIEGNLDKNKTKGNFSMLFEDGGMNMRNVWDSVVS